MLLKYNLDVEKDFKWIMITANQNAKELLFYVSEIGHFNAGKDFYTERSEKKEYYILFTISGEGVLKHKDQTIRLKKNHAVMIYCNEYQYYATANEDNWNHMWVHFNGTGADSYDNIINDSGVSCVHIDDPEKFINEMEEIMKNPGVNDIKQSVMASLHLTNMLTMMALGKYSVQNLKKYSQHQEYIDKILEYIKNNYQDPITLEDLTSEIHLSKYYFLKIFNQYTGMTPYEYLIHYRINKAKTLLRTTSLPVAQVAHCVGFLDECNFIKRFKLLTGTTPLNFRQMSF